MKPNEPLPATVEGSRAAAVHGLRARQLFEATDCVAVEVPIALEYNGVSHAVMLASPRDLEDFAYGFSITEGIVDRRAQIRDIEVVHGTQGITLQVTIASECFVRLKDRRRSMTGRTGCGLCGTDSLAQAVRLPHVLPVGAVYASSAVVRAMASLRGQQGLLDATGATHAAAWCSADGDIQLLREDVGRHNALDKVIGAIQRAGLPAASGFMVVTSRASYEMVHKTAVAGVPLLAAVSGVTALAIDVAQHAGIALLGFVRGEDLSVYAHGERLHFTSLAPITPEKP
ncbi:MAG: formate dehydrogenase accessory sulfurtransferase FdhD [Comamonadaceae bacterium]|nr:MAG: formate dehydrogenase accessory sulfurtransferase FdhD [Comamonadaceae bacterium]